MAFTEPRFKPHLVDVAGEVLVGFHDGVADLGGEDIYTIINNWRAAHGYPLNTFQMTLRRWARQIYPKALVTQRIKRLEAIEQKLGSKHGQFKLSEMQDIGGCRAVVDTVEQVYRIAERYEDSDFQHELDYRNDYIEGPNARSGYRSLHLIYKHRSRARPVYNGQRIEVQLRTSLQHTWATAVETADIFLREGLKAKRGSPDWTRFFILMSSVFASWENCRRVPRTPPDMGALKAELAALSKKLDVFSKFRSFQASLRVMERHRRKGNLYSVLVLNPAARMVTIYDFLPSAFEQASKLYVEIERNKPEGGDVLLVKADDAASIRRMYPSYFPTTKEFLECVRRAIS
jgi:hypothetical protein